MKVQKFKLLDYLNSVFENIDLDGCHVICVQHIVASTISLFNALFENGLNPKNLSAIGKCYSTRPEALKHLLEKSVDVAHGFSLLDFNVNENLEPGKEITVEFIADKKGTFTFYCSVPCGANHKEMKGKLIVK